MNLLAWIEPAFAAEGCKVPPDFQKIIARKEQDQGPFYFSSAQEAIEDTKRTCLLYPDFHILAFGRRLDYDGVISLVLSDGVRPKGSILILHWDGGPGTEIDDEYPSLEEWAKSAEEEIAERIRMGWDAPDSL